MTHTIGDFGQRLHSAVAWTEICTPNLNLCMRAEAKRC